MLKQRNRLMKKKMYNHHDDCDYHCNALGFRMSYIEITSNWPLTFCPSFVWNACDNHRILESSNRFPLAQARKRGKERRARPKRSGHKHSKPWKIPFKFILNRSQNWLISRKLESGNKRMCRHRWCRLVLLFSSSLIVASFLFVCRFVSLLAYL